MSVTIGIMIIPQAVGGFAGVLVAAASAAAASMGLAAEEETAAKTKVSGNSVALSLDNSEPIAADLSVGQQKTFHGNGVTVLFRLDGEGRSSVHVSGHKSEEELRELGEALAKRIAQQYAYHRIVAEMRDRNMNIVEEEIEQDGTVRMRVRIHQG